MALTRSSAVIKLALAAAGIGRTIRRQSLVFQPAADTQATITGESAPVEKGLDIVYAGTINQSGTLEVVADRLGRDTSFGKIVEAVEHAERSRAPVQKTADRYAGYLVYFALACAETSQF